jgi:hypothetical protein
VVATISKQFTTDSSEAELFPIGKMRLACSEGLQASLHFGTSILHAVRVHGNRISMVRRFACLALSMFFLEIGHFGACVLRALEITIYQNVGLDAP